ncbi:MAG TPA: M20/M25/M40 family metallo-hydrolase [Bryobacteraceae bacterium]|nr:M20/M25/M40 family metallo-hydrolase [Bryobacteraceae bacterium]
MLGTAAAARASDTLEELTRHYLIDLIRLDTTNPPGNETRVAQYLKTVCDTEGIESETLGADPARLNFLARIKGSGKQKPLLVMAHSDVVPADRSQWTVDPFSAEIRDGMLYGRGAQDDKSLLAAELAVLVDLKRTGARLNRDVILLSEADEEAGSSGIQWLIANAWDKINAQFAVNEGGFAITTGSGQRIYEIQTTEKIPTRVILVAQGTAGHGSLPRDDNPVVHLARAIVRVAEADQPVRLNTTTRRYLHALAKLPDYKWLEPLLPRLENASTSTAVANQIRARDAELATMLRTTVSPTILAAGNKINVIPNTAEAQLDVRRLPNETHAEIFERVRRIVHDPAVEVRAAPGQEMPATEPSGISTPLYEVMQQTFAHTAPTALVIPYMVRGATDGSFLRQKGIDVYGAPLFLREDKESRAHGNDERISLESLTSGVRLLKEIVLAVQ